MKRTAITLVLALFTALVQGSDEDFSKEYVEHLIHESNCLETEDLTMDEVTEYAFGKNLEAADTNPKLKCFNSCLFEHTRILKNCTINEDRFAEKDKEELDELHRFLDVCKGTMTAGDRCECAHQLTRCLVEQEASAEEDK